MRGGDVHAMVRRFDEQGGMCALTGWPMELGKTASLDHIVARARGGPNTVSNLRWVHASVNYAKRTMSDEEFVAMCRAVVARNSQP